MVTAKFDGKYVTTVYGLTQWDYGQELDVISDFGIPDGTEIHFHQGVTATTRYLKSGKVLIPDAMLQDDQTISAYVYIRTEDSGETVLTAYLRITAREKPSEYILPDTQDYRRLLPEGGEPGQVPVKLSGEAYAAGWGDKADGAKLINGYLQLMSGNREVGERVRIQGEVGREVELRNNGTAIEWRYTDSNEWRNLVHLEDIRGPAGEAPEFEIRDGHLYAIYKK